MPVRSLEQLRNVVRPPWIWEGFIATKSFTLFSAYPKVGKTTMLFHMIRALMTGEGFLDRATRQVPILYISEEADTLLAERADGLGFQDSWPIGWITPEPGLNWDKVVLYMKRWVYVHGNPLIIVDTLSRFWDASSENDASQVNHALNPVLEVIRNSDASFFGIHHNRKQGGGAGLAVRGSTALTGGVDIIMELTRTSSFDRSSVRRLQCESRYSETPGLLQVSLQEDGYVVNDEESLEAEPLIISILQTLEQITVSDLSVLSGLPETSLRRALTSLVQNSIIHRSGSGTSRSPYTYTLAVMKD